MGVSKDCGSESNHGLISTGSFFGSSLVESMSLHTIRSIASLAHHGASMYVLGFAKRFSTLGFASNLLLLVLKVRWVGTCSMMELGSMVLVVRRPSPPPMIGDPAATCISFRLNELKEESEV